jgi:ATP-binding cassette, subfamily C (CFTR/MRP), member 1
MESQTTARVDLSQKALYTLFCLQRWLNVVVDLTTAGIAVGTIALALALRDSTTGGDVGVALNVVLVANTTLLRLIESWATLETSLGAVARMKAMKRDTPVEDLPNERFVPPANWPSDGAVEIRGLTASYG